MDKPCLSGKRHRAAAFGFKNHIKFSLGCPNARGWGQGNVSKGVFDVEGQSAPPRINTANDAILTNQTKPTNQLRNSETGAA